jgi:hypothetical protein
MRPNSNRNIHNILEINCHFRPRGAHKRRPVSAGREGDDGRSGARGLHFLFNRVPEQKIRLVKYLLKVVDQYQGPAIVVSVLPLHVQRGLGLGGWTLRQEYLNGVLRARRL